MTDAGQGGLSFAEFCLRSDAFWFPLSSSGNGADLLEWIWSAVSSSWKALVRGWKARANQELIAQMREHLARLPQVVWHWVRGHEGVELNERCDALAREAIERRSSTVETIP